MVVDGRTELASPDLRPRPPPPPRRQARLPRRQQNRHRTASPPAAENFRRLGFANDLPHLRRTRRSASATCSTPSSQRCPVAEPPAEIEARNCRDDEHPPQKTTPTATFTAPTANSSSSRPRSPSSAAPTSANPPCSTPSPAPTAPSSRPSPEPPATPSTKSSTRRATRLPLRRHRRHPPQGQDPPHGREALRRHGPQAPRSRRRRPPRHRRHRRRHRPRRHHRRLRPRERPLRHHRRQQVGLSVTNRAAPTANQPADHKSLREQVRDALQVSLDYAPLVFISAIARQRPRRSVFKKIDPLVARERRKRVTTGQMNRFLAKVDFQRATVPMEPPHSHLLHDPGRRRPAHLHPLHRPADVKLHFAFERFLENQIRDAFGFKAPPSGSKSAPGIKKAQTEGRPYSRPAVASYQTGGASSRREAVAGGKRSEVPNTR